MRDVTLGSTGITVPQNGFGALPLQRIGEDEAVALVRAAFSGGMRYFDTARAYSNSEHRVGLALEGVRERAFVATKTMARTPRRSGPTLRSRWPSCAQTTSTSISSTASTRRTLPVTERACTSACKRRRPRARCATSA